MRAYWLWIILCLVFGACGSDDSQKSNDVTSPGETEENKESNSDKKNPKEVDPDEDQDYIKSSLPSNIELSIDTVRDNYRSTNIYYIRVGNAVWNSQKNTATSSGVESVCYDEQNGNCDDFGRLYLRDGNLNTVCPDGMNLPSSKDWELLESYRSENRKIDKLLSFTYGGYCEKTNGKFKCSDLNSSANYLTSDGKVYSLKKGATSASFKTAKENGFYNILCVGYPSYVKAKKDLPACDNVKKNPPTLAYVFEEKQNYRCYPDTKSWLPDFTENCSNNRKTFIVNDTMMICQDEIWQLATISESPEVCETSKQGKVFKFNGEKYVCDQRKWRKPTALEDSLGVCNSRKAETIDTLFQGNEIELYYCNGSKWRVATMSDFVGDCNDEKSKHLYDTLDFKNTHYICRGNGWERITKLEERFGVCIPKKQFMFETGTYDIYDEKTEYMCDTTITFVCKDSTAKSAVCDSTNGEKRMTYAWKKYSVGDIFGPCKASEMTEFRDSYYECREGFYGYYWDSYKIGSAYRGSDRFNDCDSSTVNLIMNSNGNYYYTRVCSNDNDYYYIRTVTFPECSRENHGEIYTVDSTGVSYYCNGEKNSWRSFLDGVDKCLSDNYGKMGKTTKFGYVICDTIGWKSISKTEYDIGLCDKKSNMQVKTYNGSKVMCIDWFWFTYKEKDSYRVTGKAKGGK